MRAAFLTFKPTVVITGASAHGLGAQTALDLAKANPAHLLLLARSATKVQPVIDEIARLSPTTRTSFVSISLDDLESVRSAAAEVISQLASGKIDVLINNAGIMAVPFAKTKLGVESQFATNHLGHFVLTLHLTPYIRAAGEEGRVVNLASDGYLICPFRPDNINFDDGKSYHPFSAYGQSKTANILFTKGLAKRGITSFAVHPGVIVSTSLARSLDMSLLDAIDEVAKQNTGQGFTMGEAKNIEQGVATTIRAAIDPEIANDNGSYMAGCQAEDVRGYAKDDGLVGKLWALSEQLVGEKFEI